MTPDETAGRTGPEPALVLDWDGTATERDTLHLTIERFGDLDVFRTLEAELGRKLTLQEVIATEIATVRAPLEEVVGFLVATVRIRPGFAEVVACLDPLVVSAGFHELIEPVLAREGLRPRVLANTVAPAPEGWLPTFRDTTPCPVCGEPCKRGAVAGLGPFAYAGDGFSDRCVALAAARVFARDGLARHLDGLGATYEPLVDFHDLLARW
jgi:2-hydroxy-3-keto-5-methylthiopentenyl-1-phosphate phosphatase